MEAVPELRERARLDLSNPFAREVQLLADLSERARFAPVEAEPQRKEPALTIAQRQEQLLERRREDRIRGRVERRLCGPVLDDIAEVCLAVFPQRFGQRPRV